MRKFKGYLSIFLCLLFLTCQNKTSDKQATILITELSQNELSDKVKGMVVGSAIGDAMGAPTEMWNRDDIQNTYGWVTGLDPMVREVSPEGIWKANLPAGGTTDDTRWKALIADYLAKQNNLNLNVKAFSKHIIKAYEEYFDTYGSLQPEETEARLAANLRVLWLQEWYKVSLAIQENDFIAYHKALGKFYGGEMVCAGLLYAPSIGLLYPGQPEMAYSQAFELSIFDLGIAKDISALSAAMTAAALTAAGDQNKVLNVLRDIDPEGYFSSRLVGRSSYRIYELARDIVTEAKDSLASKENALDPSIIPDVNTYRAYLLLDQHLQDMPFHAAEIQLQVLTAMLFNDFKFTESLIFLVNFGRDNDTTAAIAGAILGAYHGFKQLPEGMREEVIKVNKEFLDIDLEKMAEKQTQNISALYLWPE